MGYQRCHGEASADPAQLKSVMEASVRSRNRHVRKRSLSLVVNLQRLGVSAMGTLPALSRNGRQSALSGVQPTTYHTTGSSCEHGNLESSAGPAKSGKPPGPATSRPRDGASVVVRARESRAHGEGGQ